MSNANQKTVRTIRYERDDEVVFEVDAFGYGRHSTDQQSQRSADDQLSQIRRGHDAGRLKSRLFPSAKINLIDEYKDEAVSGFSTVGRAGLDQALSGVRQGRAKIIVVSDFKRFLRGVGTALELYQFLQDHGAELISLSDGFSSAEPGARLKFIGKAVASEEFLEAVSIDTTRGLNEKRSQGFSDGHLWFGVSSKSTTQVPHKGGMKDTDFEYQIIPRLADLVLRIFTLYAKQGYSTKEIAKTLNAEGIPSPSGYNRKTGAVKENRKPCLWKDKAVWHILNNKSYIGIVERGCTRVIRRNDGKKQTIHVPRDQWNVTEIEHVRIVPQDLWEEARRRVDDYNKAQARRPSTETKPFKFDGTVKHVLTGICKCGDCGSDITVVSGRHGGRYGCSGHHKFNTCSNNKTISWRKLEPVVLGLITKEIEDEEVFRTLATKYNDQIKKASSTDTRDLVRLEARLNEVTVSVGNIVQAIERGIASETLTQRLAVLESERLKLTDQVKYLRGLDQSQVLMTPQAIKERFREVPAILMTRQPHEVNRALRQLFLRNHYPKLERRPEGKSDCYWVTGSLDLGRVVGISRKAVGDATYMEVEPRRRVLQRR